jgi:NodT family efflux transporter outer membrane factor (OMF) lipoprotein
MRTRFLAPATALAALLAAGCTVGPNFVRPEPPRGGYLHAAPAPGGARSVANGADVADDWYRLFHSTALDQLVRSALADNPDLKAARHGLLAAQYELKAVAGAELPQLNATGQFTRAHENGSLFYEPVTALRVTGNQWELGPSLAYNLDPFGGTRRQVESQRAATAVARDQALNTYVTLVDQTVITAFDYAATEAQIEVTHSLVEELQSQYELTRTLENAGKVIRSDTLQAQTQLENLRATLPALEQQRDAYRNALAQLTGKTPDEFRSPALSLRDFTLPGQLPVSLPAALVRQRPDVLAAEDSLHQASAEVGVATAARLPSLTLSAQYAQQSNVTSNLFSNAANVWSAGLNATAPIFHGGTLAARQHEAQERYRQSLEAYRSTVLTAFVEVANALQALQHDSEGYLAHTTALAAAQSNRDLAVEEYRAGKYTELQVLTAEQQYQDAALSEVQADVQRFTDTAALFRALGGGWWNAPRDPTTLAALTTTTPASPPETGGTSGESHE